MTLTPPDAQAREAALNPHRSLIVQAPAGSGKTTLLAERYVNLLAIVDRPEQILAITFTRKAAAEMRQRVLSLLSQDSPAASRANERGQALGWSLSSNPNVLKIQTIDSFALELASQVPGTQLPPAYTLKENAQSLYERAAASLLLQLYEDRPTNPMVAELLASLDNDADRAVRLIGSALARRDQWLAPVTAAAAMDGGIDALRSMRELAVADLTQHGLEEVQREFAPADFAMLDLYTRASSANDRSTAIPQLMTRSGQLRKRLTAKDGIADTTLRRQLNTWLDTLHGRGLAPALSAFAKLPRPEAGIDNTPTLQLYCVGLALAAIELERILQAEGCLDFTGLLLRAQAALRNSEDAPTDLALYLDYQIRHVLIDEFQDTSRSQLKLFEHLIDGWQANDGTSLFMVGDPMQSIYRFRDADVSIFAEVQQAGLAGVALEPCGLQANFRSQPTLVEWCNGVFTKLFAAGARQPGAVSFNPSLPIVKPQQADPVECLMFRHTTAETQSVVARIRHLLAVEDDSDIAVLCRVRNHVSELLIALDAARIPWQATDVHLLRDEPVITDLMSLHALIIAPASELSRYSLLRSPMFGMTLAELTTMAEEASADWLERRAATDTRSARLASALSWARHHLDELSMREVLEGCWFRCGGHHAYPAAQMTHAMRLFDLLDDLRLDATEPKALAEALDRLFSEPAGAARVKIMTIHKSKGLEFDHVLVPYLDRSPRHDETQLLMWRPCPRGLLMGARDDAIHRWLRYESGAQATSEATRLLYVACTRARRSLQLSFVVPDDQKEARGLAALLCDVARPGPSKATTVADAKSPSAGPLTRLPTDFVWRPPALDAPLESSVVRVPPVEDPIADRFEVIVGISVHRALAWMATYQRSLDETIHRIPYWLAEQGDGAQQRAELEAEVTHHLTTAATSAQGRWILHPHEQHECEVALSSINEGAVVHVILDRTFVEHDTRWVIDFKTSEQTDAPAVARYQNQLSLYRRIAQSIYGPPVRSALFFTRNAHFVELS